MRYSALATDYDGTLAHHGRVDEPTLAALGWIRATGRRLVLVTGRELDELLGIFPRIVLFDRVVAENGALLYRPEGKQEVVCPGPHAWFPARPRSVRAVGWAFCKYDAASDGSAAAPRGATSGGSRDQGRHPATRGDGPSLASSAAIL
jgi:hypothetical protein